MDSMEASNIVYSRIRKLESEEVAIKVIGCLLLQDDKQEMIRLAFGPDSSIQNFIERAKASLGSVLKPNTLPPVSPSTVLRPFQEIPFSALSPATSPVMLRPPNPFWDHQVNAAAAHQQMPQIMGFQDQFKLVNPRIRALQPNDYYCYHPEATGPPRSQRSQTLSDFPVKPCHYFIKGFCKDGRNCRYLHGGPEMFSPIRNEVGVEGEDISPQALEKLELEIAELLKSRRGRPLSIASLPILYYETFGRTLEAEGYLTESQRRGRVGYSLTKLLARLNNGVRMIERPHGQHAVVLAEDAPKYLEYYQTNRSDPGPIVCGSRQIYLTFPADSTFSEEDVAEYFNTYGPVEDVRIPCQQRRMFGFVTFACSSTVKLILSKGNPHFVCGARVLVKPYREKPKLLDRKLEPPRLYNSRHAQVDNDLQSEWETSRYLRRPYVEENGEALEVLGRRLSNLQLAHRSLANGSYFGFSMDELNVSEEEPNHPSTDCFNYLLDDVNSSSAKDDKDNPTAADKDQESQGLELPDSPFESPK